VSPETPDFIVGDWLVRPILGQASRDGEVVHLEPKVMDVLVFLVRNQGEVLSRQALTDAVWPGTFVEDQAVTRAVWRLRQALGWQKDDVLETIPKRGYRLTVPVVAVPNHGPGAVIGTGRTALPTGPSPPSPAAAPPSAPGDPSVAPHESTRHLRVTREVADLPAGARPRRRRLRMALAVAGGLLLFGAGLGVMWLLRPVAPRTSVTRLSLDVRPAEELNAGWVGAVLQPIPGGVHTALAWTPDGRELVFIGRHTRRLQIYVRPLDRNEARPLEGSEGARGLAVSADGQWVAFWAGGALKKMPLAGGLAAQIAALPAIPSGLAWDARGNLYFDGAGKRIYRASAAGGVTAVTAADDFTRGAGRHILPSVLPGGEVLLFTLRKRDHIGWGDEEVVAQVLATGERKHLLTDAADARYVPPGRLLFMRRGTLFGVPFDPDAVKTLGPEVPLLAGVSQAVAAGHPIDTTGAGQFSVSSTGTLAWIPGPAPAYPERALVWVDRRGSVSAVDAPPRTYGGPYLSPDGRLVSLGVLTLAGERAWIFDLVRGTSTPVNTDAEVSWGMWSRDGQRVVFRTLSNGRYSLAWQRVDGNGPLEVLAPGSDMIPSSWTPDGRQLAGCFAAGSSTGTDMAMATIDNGHARVDALARTEPSEGCPEFSPDGRWIAYHSDLTGRREIYVQPYPGPGARTRVSIDGGSCPAWSKNGRELFFLALADAAGKRRMMVARVTPGWSIGRPGPLFEFDGADLRFDCAFRRCYDVSADGQRFLLTRSRPAQPPYSPVTHVNLIQNWLEELKAKVPSSR
jgi:eukaryotic-like serine/threonine-protein kinase